MAEPGSGRGETGRCFAADFENGGRDYELRNAGNF